MVTVFLKDGEKAPMLDANYVRLEPGEAGAGVLLRCFVGGREAGQGPQAAPSFNQVTRRTCRVTWLPHGLED